MVLGSIWPLTEPGAVLTLRCKQTTMLMVLIGPHPESISAFPSCTRSWTLHLIRDCNVCWVHFNSLFSIFMSILGKLGTVSRWVPNHHRAQIYMFWAIYKRGMEIRKTLMGQESNRPLGYRSCFNSLTYIFTWNWRRRAFSRTGRKISGYIGESYRERSNGWSLTILSSITVVSISTAVYLPAAFSALVLTLLDFAVLTVPPYPPTRGAWGYLSSIWERWGFVLGFDSCIPWNGVGVLTD